MYPDLNHFWIGFLYKKFFQKKSNPPPSNNGYFWRVLSSKYHRYDLGWLKRRWIKKDEARRNWEATNQSLVILGVTRCKIYAPKAHAVNNLCTSSFDIFFFLFSATKTNHWAKRTNHWPRKTNYWLIRIKNYKVICSFIIPSISKS